MAKSAFKKSLLSTTTHSESSYPLASHHIFPSFLSLDTSEIFPYREKMKKRSQKIEYARADETGLISVIPKIKYG